ncbi:retrovirus-related Pol polyprotein from transposon 17.6 [Trichonephila inaurata madagascariensis]|uniref:Retrovirus-related Pol polyprotein from transposon 17.6 n=1 Tax=Trichonephila inaurata madagascariensis TaxID=2747483 RepID=A0A8X6X3G9_9ARAC|nr:retrovirus-related Pol polyprotein from transposon 17.6 [Trichonephila inaurata madagascariensis]
MAFLLSKKKEDLIELAEELGLIVEAGLTKPKLKDLIVKSPDYVEEDVKLMFDSIVKDHISTEEKAKKLRREEREYEQEKLRIQAEKNTNTMNNSENVQVPKLIHETFHKFNMKDDISLNLTLFERHTELTFLPKDWVQKELMRKGVVIIYMDDLIIPAKDEKEGLEKLKEVLEVASKYGLEMKFKKCQFLRRKVEFLGHVVENGTIRPSIAKTIAVKKFPVPTTVKQVQSFLGLTGYFRKFIPAYSQIAKPLSDLTRRDNPFMFEQPQMEAFEKLKKLLTESPVLSIFQQGKTTELHTDASQQGYGAVLLQEAEDGKLHPVQYMSQKTTPAEEKYSSYELEVLAVINALKKFRTYLLGNNFKIITDCSAFQKTMNKKRFSYSYSKMGITVRRV